MKLLVWEADALQRVQAAGQGSPVSAHRRLGFREAPGLIFCSLIVLKLEAFDEDGFFFLFQFTRIFSCENTNLVIVRNGKYQNNKNVSK